MEFRLVAALGVACSLMLGHFAVQAADTTAAQTAETTVQAADTAPAASLSDKWRIEISGGANSDGYMVFRITPDQGTAVDVKVMIDDGRGENAVAGDIKRAMEKALDRKTFHVEVDDGEDVLVKKRKGPDFAVELVESTVKNTKVKFDKE